MINSVLTNTETTVASTPQEKQSRLVALLRSYRSVIVAYSGGVDSTYLSAIAHEALGDKALIVTAQSPSLAEAEFVFATTLARDRGWNFRVVKTRETADPRWQQNDASRCYFCKSELFRVLGDLVRAEGIVRVLYGAIPDDLADVRPGQRAAAEYEALAPLIDVGLTKKQIRLLSQERDLPSWDKPQAACLASRFPTGTAINDDALRQVDRAEAALLALGFCGHRVRHHESLARVELQSHDWGKIGDRDLRDRMVSALKSAGYKHVTLDLAGYQPAGQNQ